MIPGLGGLVLPGLLIGGTLFAAMSSSKNVPWINYNRNGCGC